MKNIGFIGLGRMGSPMASNLIKKGFKLKVFDINNSSMKALIQKGASQAKSVFDLAKSSDITITMLPNSEIVTEVITGPNGVLSSGKSGSKCKS